MIDYWGSHLPALRFRFNVVEYLKGRGETEMDVEVPLKLDYILADPVKAEAIADHMHDGRDRTYEDREAIVFLLPSREGDYVWSEGTSTMYRFTAPHGHFGFPAYTHEYAITSDYNRAWLPSTDADGTSGTSDPTEITYLTGPPSSPAQGASGIVSPATPPISLAEINMQIEIIGALVHVGYDIPGFMECQRQAFRHSAEIREWPIRPHVVEREIPSGQPAGYRLWPVPSERSGDPYYNRQWVEGPDSALFEMRMTDEDGEPTTGYTWEEVTTRPVPGGTYTIFYKSQPASWVPCNYNPALYEKGTEGVISVTAPADTVHEALFDPVEFGSAVGSDGDNGVPNPASFTMETAGSVTIDRIDWRSGRVEIELEPHSAAGLVGHHVDFIALDASVVLRLYFDDAVEVDHDGARALSWNVCDQPWKGGDLLMLRISESKSEVTEATDPGGPCPGDGNKPPAFASSSYTFDIPENAPTSTLAGVVAAVDHESGDVLSYSILPGTGHGQFDIDGGTGEITVTGVLDYETMRSHTLTVVAKDADGAAAMIPVTILVTNVIEPPAAPQNVSATSTHNRAILTWDAPDDPGLTGLEVRLKRAGQDPRVFEIVSFRMPETKEGVGRVEVPLDTDYIYCVHFVNYEGVSEGSCVTIETLPGP